MIGIKGLGMPRSCFYCPLRHEHFGLAKQFCGALCFISDDSKLWELNLKDIKEKRSSKCPLVEIKEEIEND